jgi:hypothetical protein
MIRNHVKSLEKSCFAGWQIHDLVCEAESALSAIHEWCFLRCTVCLLAIPAKVDFIDPSAFQESRIQHLTIHLQNRHY